MKIASEEKINTRQALYGGGVLVGAIACIAQAFHLITADEAITLGNLLDAAGKFIPTGSLTVAAAVLRYQNTVPGMLSPAPEPTSPLDQVSNGLKDLVQAEADAAQQHAGALSDLEQAKQVTAATLGAAVNSLAGEVFAAVADK